jgi:hypothetical protein
MDTENELTVRDGETVQDAALRVGKRANETWDEFRARRLTEDATFRQDAGGDDDEAPVLDANAEREAMISRRLLASGATRPPEAAEPNAEQARKDMIKRQRDAWKTSAKKKAEGPKPPKSASEAKAEEEGEDEPGEEGEEGEEDAAASRQRMIDKKYGRAK